MRLTAHQPAFMPWLGFFDKLSKADRFIVFDNVPFERHGYSNRVQIKTQTGDQWLTVPVLMNGHTTKPICELEIAPGNWRRKHLRTIELAYLHAPYFEVYFTALKAIYEKEWRYLSGLNGAILAWLMKELGYCIPVSYASEQGFEGVKSALVLDMCIKSGTKHYIFGEKGRDYADVEAFEKAGITVEFQQYRHPVYPQLHGDFIHGLSVLDLLMNHGPESGKILENKHEFV